MTRLAQLALTSKTRGLIVWTFWENGVDLNKAPYVSSSIDAYGNTKTHQYNTIQAMRAGYQTLVGEYGYQPVA